MLTLVQFKIVIETDMILKRGPNYIKDNSRRNFDVATAGMLLVASSPVAVAVAVEAMIEHRQLNPFFFQDREGQNGETTTTPKFQTCRPQADGSEAPLHSGWRHPDSTKAEQFIRRSGADEIPQLVAVLAGKLSIVGIRPETTECLDIRRSIAPSDVWEEWLDCYHLRQGITGRGQLELKGREEERSDEEVVAAMIGEIQDTRNASLLGDMRILAATPFILLRSLASRPITLIEPIEAPAEAI